MGTRSNKKQKLKEAQSALDKRRKNPKVRKEVIKLHKRGKTTREIADALSIPSGSVCAWIAHYTRGTYGAA